MDSPEKPVTAGETPLSPASSTLRPGDRLELALESWGRLGEAMARHEETPVFVFGGVPGERVTAEVVRVHRKYVSAKVVGVLEPSQDRVEPPCPYFGECGMPMAAPRLLRATGGQARESDGRPGSRWWS